MNSTLVTLCALISACIVAGCASDSNASAPVPANTQTAAAPAAPTSAVTTPVVTAPPPAATPAPVAAPSPKKVNITKAVYFNANQTSLTKEAKLELDALIEKVKVMKRLEVIVAIGHTGKGGTAAEMVKQGMRRADAVKKYLMVKGVPANKIYTDSKGYSELVFDNPSPEERVKNRRVEIELIGLSFN